MIAQDIKLLDEISQTRNLAFKTKQSYKNALKLYVSLQNKSFIDLLKEADIEEEMGVRWKNRKLKYRLINFRLFLQKNYLVTTSKVYFQRILTLYRHFEIEIHDLPPTSNKSVKMSKPITFQDLPTKKIIRDAVEIANPIMKAIILFISSSGCARRETLNLTVGDFIDATYEYHRTDNIKEALDSLKELDFIIPIFKIRRQKTNKFYFTFCSHEASKFIVDYLINLDYELTLEDKLFNLNLYYWNKYFNNINTQLNLGKVGEYNKFRSHMLRKFHASSLYNVNGGLTLSEIDALQGRGKNSTHASYFMENPQNLKEKYINSLKAITIFS
ncbi:MAG: site-specific integrase [Methanobrevibacter thaueri]|uniref:site-specific integrase n=1 Tax=Methanobrevibacter thaueri TaxID=190975 RepID=UPI0026EFDAE2|nr:site-specific integrase [Methanobrevibacter thaueri]MBE6496245.1 site-specific integrase [Methanobrevibacter thaueri]